MHTLVMAAVYSNLGLTVADGVKESILCNIHPVTWDIIVKRLLVCFPSLLMLAIIFVVIPAASLILLEKEKS